jgi:alanine racemase
MHTKRPLVARIDSAALTHNLGVARLAASGARVLAVIKANAYGHGLLRAAAALSQADGFAVLTLDEALVLRGAGFSHPIVLLEGFFSPDEIEAFAHARLRPVVHREDQITLLEYSRPSHRIDVLLKIDTGMHRLGIAPGRVLPALERLRSCSHVGSITLMTHFACADDDTIGVSAQMTQFTTATAGLDLPTCLANSAALLRHPQTRGDWVRPGIMLYGASPFAAQTGADLGLLPAMSLESRLIAVRRIHKGEGLGYGHAFIAPQDMNIGVVACGYADGYPRHAPTGTPIWVEGRETRTLGRVSMDMLCVDLAPCSNAHVGSPVTLWGGDLPVERVAAAAGTIAYELFTALAPRVSCEEI